MATREQALENLEKAQAAVREVRETLTPEDTWAILTNTVDTVELVAKKLAQENALRMVIDAEEVLRHTSK